MSTAPPPAPTPLAGGLALLAIGTITALATRSERQRSDHPTTT